MYFNCTMAGFGGQGILSAGMMLANMAANRDLQVTWFPAYGAEQRGGTANCTVVISDVEIGSPIISNPLYGFLMNMPSLTKFQPRFKTGAQVVVDTTLIDPAACTREDISFYGISAADEARKLGNVKVANMIMIGALLKVSGLFTMDVAEAALADTLPKKYHHLLPINKKALETGFSVIAKI